jgi:hypothetical protein
MNIMRTEAQIQAEIDAKTRELEAVRAEAAKNAALPADKQLALELHELLCRWNHTDGCSWFYEKDWVGYSHERYLEKARAVLADTKMDLASIVTVIHALK